MKHFRFTVVGLLATVFVLGSLGCSRASTTGTKSDQIVGAWFVKEPGAPFQYHMYVFNADGTMQQANPDAGDANESDSGGRGVWVADGGRIRGKWVEVTADRLTHQFAGRGELSYDIAVNGNTFAGTAAYRSYDVNGVLVHGPSDSSLLGERVTLP